MSELGQEEIDPQLHKLTNAALGLLARREYSRGELEERLLRRSSDQRIVDQVLDALAEQGMQSDQRFTENFVRYRIAQGKGPIRIRQDLRQKQISSEHIDQHLDQDADFWAHCAKEVYSRKYGCQAFNGEKDFAKRLRFMVSRGFSAQQVYPLIEQSKLDNADSEQNFDD